MPNSIYDIDAALLALADPETGEIADYEAFQALTMERDAKIENVARWVKNLAALSDSIKAEQAKLRDRKTVVDNQIARLKEYLGYALDGHKFECGAVRVSFRHSDAVQITDDVSVVAYLLEHQHEDCLRRPAPQIAKEPLKALIQSGETVPGAAIVKNRSVIVK